MNYIEKLYDITHSYEIWREYAHYDEDDGYHFRSEPLYNACLKPRFRNLTLEDWNNLLEEYIKKHPNKVQTKEQLLFCSGKDYKLYVPFYDIDGLGSKLTGGFKKKYPSFTADKQLEIIKLIISNTDLHINRQGMSSLSKDYDLIEVENSNFSQALTQLTTELMDTGELDKEKVKEILQR